MMDDMLVFDNVRYSRPDAYKAGLVDEDGNLLATKQVPSFTAVSKEAYDETAVEADKPKKEDED